MLAKELKQILLKMCEYGLGNLYILHPTKTHVYFGNISFNKCHLSIIDTSLLKGLQADLFTPAANEGLVGMICWSENKTWESLTFYGLDKCQLTPDFSNTRGSAIIAAQNQYGDSIINFEGSVYRGFQLLLEHSFLPAIIIYPVKSKYNETGLAVTDLRTVPLDIKLLIKLNDTVVNSIEAYKTLAVDDLDLSKSDFHKYFNGFIES
jgi:hypothetical protein